MVLLASFSESCQIARKDGAIIHKYFTQKEGKNRIKIIPGDFGYDSLIIVGPNDQAFWENW